METRNAGREEEVYRQGTKSWGGGSGFLFLLRGKMWSWSCCLLVPVWAWSLIFLTIIVIQYSTGPGLYSGVYCTVQLCTVQSAGKVSAVCCVSVAIQTVMETELSDDGNPSCQCSSSSCSLSTSSPSSPRTSLSRSSPSASLRTVLVTVLLVLLPHPCFSHQCSHHYPRDHQVSIVTGNIFHINIANIFHPPAKYFDPSLVVVMLVVSVVLLYHVFTFDRHLLQLRVTGG